MSDRTVSRSLSKGVDVVEPDVVTPGNDNISTAPLKTNTPLGEVGTDNVESKGRYPLRNKGVKVVETEWVPDRVLEYKLNDKSKED